MLFECVQEPNVGAVRVIRKQLTVIDKSYLQALRVAGKTFREIGNLMEIDQRTAARCYKRMVDSNRYDRKSGSGKKRQTSERENQGILRVV